MNKKVLVIEDDEAIRFTVKQLLEDEGFDVDIAVNGKEAVAILEEKQLPDIIVLDIVMPKMDGWQFLEYMDKQAHMNIPIVVMSAARDAEKKLPPQVRFLQKPFNIADFIGAMKTSNRVFSTIAAWIMRTMVLDT